MMRNYILQLVVIKNPTRNIEIVEKIVAMNIKSNDFFTITFTFMVTLLTVQASRVNFTNTLTCVSDTMFCAKINTTLSKLHSNTTFESFDMLIIKNATKLKNFPNGLKTNFPKLKGIAITNGGLVSLNKKNLKKFGDKLEYAHFEYNKISTLDADLFDGTPNLVEVSFRGNKLKSIKPALFEKLQNLSKIEFVSFEKCGCINQVFNKKADNDISKMKWTKNCTIAVPKTTTTFPYTEIIGIGGVLIIIILMKFLLCPNTDFGIKFNNNTPNRGITIEIDNLNDDDEVSQFSLSSD